jgi:hypothetical protein
MQVTQWQYVQADTSEYSHMWANQDAFKPETFSHNARVENKWNDCLWAVIFWINFLIVVCLVIYCGVQYKKKHDEEHEKHLALGDQIDEISNAALGRVVGVGFAIGVVANIVHYCYATFAPLIYMKFGLFIGFVLSVLFCLAAMFQGYWGVLLFPGLMLVLVVIMYCIMRRYIPLSAAIFQITTRIICRYPSILVLVLFQGIVETVMAIGFGMWIYFINYIKWSPWVYIYLVFSFFWITLTFGYVVYLTCAGLGASWYFLNNSNFEPRFPVWESFKRACTTSFGSASFAGFILAVIETLKFLIETNVKGNDKGATCIAILKCIALCVLAILEACMKWITRYALIYCATFGVPFKEGCRRWAELSCKKFVNVLMGGNVINRSLVFNFLLFTVGGALIGFGLGKAVVNEPIDPNAQRAFLAVSACLFTLCIFAVLEKPLVSVSDTLLVCYAEAPEQLRTTASDLYDALARYYGEAVLEKSLP